MSTQQTAPGREIAFVNGNLAHLETLIAGLRAGIEIVVLDAGTDGLEQIQDVLAGRSDLAAIHLIGHGATGVLQVGNTQLDTAYLKSNEQAMATIGASLAANGDILVYGCDTGAGSEGIEFARTLGALTGADVAASDDLTGAGGDWALEVAEGQVDAATIMDDAGAAAYMSTLALSTAPVHTYSQNTWAFSSMAQGADGSLYLAHKIDYTAISIKKWTGDGWTEITKLTTAMTGDTSFSDDLSLMVDADGNIDLLFKHAKNITSGIDSMRGIKFGEFNIASSTWTTKVIDQASHPNGWYNYDDPALAIAGNGVLHAVYNFADASVHDYSIKYATSSDGGDNWVTSTVLTTTIAGIDELHQPTIRVDAAGNVHMFYVREDNQNDDYGNLYYATKAAGNSTWSVPLQIASHLETQFVIGTDGSGKFYIGHTRFSVDAEDQVTGTSVQMLSNESGSWVDSTVIAEGRNSYPYGIQVQNGDVFMLVYSDALDWTNQNLYMMRKSGDTWVRGHSGESALPSLSVQGEDYFGEATFSISPTGEITVVTEDGNLRNVASTTGSLEDFGLVVNAAPILSGLHNDAGEFGAGSGDSIFIDVQDETSDPVGVTDTDSADFNGGKVTVTQVGGNADGSFSFDFLGETIAVGVDLSSLGGTPSPNDKVYYNSGGSWTEIGRVHATLDGQDGRGLVIEFTSTSADSYAAEAVIQWLTYGAPTAGARSFSLSVSDGDGATSSSATFTMTGIDFTAPTVLSVTSSTSDGVKKIGDVISIQVQFSEAVTVTGSPVLALETGSTDRSASYESGSGTNTLTFTYTVQEGDLSGDLDITAIDALSGTIVDLAGIDAILALAAPGDAGSLGAAQQIVVDGRAPSDLAISNAVITTLDGEHATVGLLSTTDGNPSDTFSYTLVAGEGDTDNAAFEISGASLRAIDASALSEGVKTVRVRTTDAAGNSYEEAFSVTVNTPPTVAISSSTDSVKAGGTATITFTFTDEPTGFVAGDVTATGGTLGEVTVDPLNSKVYTATFTPTANVQDLSAAISIAAGKFTDAGGLANVASTQNVAIAGDTLRATVTGVGSTASGLHKAGDTVSIQVQFSEVVSVDGVPVLALETGATDRSATYVSGSGTDTLTFSYTVLAGDLSGDLDVTGIGALSGGTIADLAGNDATLTLAAPGAAGSLGANASIAVDGVAPSAIALDNAAITTLDGEHAVVGALSSTDGTPDDSFTYTLVAGAGDTDNAGFEIVGGKLQAIDAAGLADGERSVRVRTVDAAGNAYEQVLAVTVTSNPTVAISTSTNTVNASGTALITFTFSAEPVGFSASGVTVTGGTLGEVTVDPLNGKVYTATFTPTAGAQVLEAAISVGADAFTNAGGLGNIASTTNVAITGDTLAPTVSIGIDKDVFKAGETATVTFTFSEVPAGFAVSDITVTGGALSGFAPTSDSKVYTATFTPAADIASLEGAISIAGAVVTDAAGNANAASTGDVTIGGDTLRPVVSDAHLSISGATGANGTFRTGDTVTVTWNDGADGDNNGDSAAATVDFSQFGGPAAVAATLDDGVWTATYQIVAGSIDSASRNVSVTVTDDAGNASTQADATNGAVDNRAPTVTDAAVSIAGASGTGGTYRIGDVVTASWNNADDGNADIAGVTFDFSQFGGGMVAASLASGVWSATYTIAATAISTGNRNVAVSVVDDAGNSSAVADSSNVQVDAVRAVVTGITSTSAAGLRKIGDTVSIQVQFSESVTVDGTPVLALETGVDGRTATYASGSGSDTLTFTYTVQAGDLTGDLDIAGIAALEGGITDAAGNDATLTLPVPGAAGSLGANEAIAVDGIAPSAVALSNATVTTLAGAHGVVGSLSATDGTPSDTFTYTLVAGDGDTDNAVFEIVGNVLQVVDAGAVADGGKSVRVRAVDAAGNAHDEVLAVTVYAPPSVAITSDAGSLNASGTATITFTFSDIPSGFSASDVTVVGGTLKGLAADPLDGKVYTATFAPTLGVQNLNAAISIGAGTFTDVSTLPNVASTANVAITGDTLVPTVAVGIDRTSFKAGETATVTFTFNETPAGFTAADISVTGGTLSGLAVTSDSKVYTATFTPEADSAGVAGAISVAGATFTDAAGNLNSASKVNVVFSADTLAPSVSDSSIAVSGASGANGAFRAGDTVTVRWNDGASGDNNGDTAAATVDFSQFGGPAAVAATLADGVWIASYQIAAGAIDSINRNVSVTVRDTAGNTAVGGDSANSTVDSQAPVVSDAMLTVAGASGGVVRIGDTVTASWNGAAGGDGNGDIAGVHFDFSQFGGGLVAATVIQGVWSASYTVTELNVDVAGRNVAVSVTDDAGNTSSRTDTANLRVDTVRPQVSSITLAGNPAASATEVDFVVQFSEAVSGLDLGDFSLVLGGATVANISSISGSGNSYTVRVSGIQGEGTLKLDLNGSGTGLADAAGNAIAGGFADGLQHSAKFNAAPAIAGAATATINLAEQLTAVTTVTASDADGDTVSYSISGGADAALFDIDAATGALRLKQAHTVAAPADSDGDNRFQVEVSAADGKGGIDVQAITVNLLADLDGDGTADSFDADIDNDGRPNSAEDPVPGAFGGTGDGNGDGVADSLQLNVASLATVVAGAPYATLAVADGFSLSSVSSSAAPSGLPRNVKMPVGQFDFTIGNVTPGGTVEMSIYVDSAKGVNGYFKQDINGVWTNLATSVTKVGGKTKVTFSLTDGGMFDSDGVVNGSISDPGGVAVIAPLIGSNGGGDSLSVRIAEMTRAVTTVSASSLGTVSYAISGGADAAHFEIDPVTGVLRFAGTPDYSVPLDAGADNTYSVQVTASDAYGSDTQSISVTVTDVATVDGVKVGTDTRTNDDGSTSQVVTVPVVVAERDEQVGDSTAADIPLVSSNGTDYLTALVPTGVGLQVTGSAAPTQVSTALTDLIREIRGVTQAGSHDQAQMTGGGSGFLSNLPTDAALLVQTVVPTAAPGAAAGSPLVIHGAAPSLGGPLSALVIDAQALPAGSEIQLHDVAFAAVVGQVRVTGGSGSQNVWGDGQNQYIMLGADDDILHGGAGNDTVGSAGGNDMIFGDEGDDLVFGGIGNDSIDGGSGIDVVRLAGSGRDDYTMRFNDGQLVLTHRNGGADGEDTVGGVETLRFMDGTADTSAQGTIARLYEALLGRAPDAEGMAAWVAAVGRGATLDAVAEHILAASEFEQLSLGNGDFVAALYVNSLGRTADAEGLAFWTGMLDAGRMSAASLALSVVESAEKLAMPVVREIGFADTDAGTLVRMYDSLYGRAPDMGGINHWLSLSEAGVAMGDIADGFIGSSEALGLYAAMSNAEFVTALYHGALHRDAKPGEVEGWTRLLDEGRLDRGDVLLGFADSAEKIGLVGVISTTIDGGVGV